MTKNGDLEKNPPNIHLMSLSISFFIFFLSLGIVLFVSSEVWIAQLFGLLFCSFLAMLFLVPITYLEVVRRPKAVLIGDPLVLTYRTWKPREVRLEEIEWVDTNLGDQSRLVGRINTGGRVKVKGDTKSLLFTYKAANLIKEEYVKKLGRNPPPYPIK